MLQHGSRGASLHEAKAAASRESCSHGCSAGFLGGRAQRSSEAEGKLPSSCAKIISILSAVPLKQFLDLLSKVFEEVIAVQTMILTNLRQAIFLAADTLQHLNFIPCIVQAASSCCPSLKSSCIVAGEGLSHVAAHGRQESRSAGSSLAPFLADTSWSHLAGDTASAKPQLVMPRTSVSCVSCLLRSLLLGP